MKKTNLHLHIIANPEAGSGKAEKSVTKNASFFR